MGPLRTLVRMWNWLVQHAKYPKLNGAVEIHNRTLMDVREHSSPNSLQGETLKL